MSDPSPSDKDLRPNAYQAPAYVPPEIVAPAIHPAQLHELSARVRAFRGYCTALGVLMCLFGVLALMLGVVTTVAALNAESPDVAAVALPGILALSTAIHLGLGIPLFFRQVWAAWAVIGLETFVLAANLVNRNANVCLFVMVALFVTLAIVVVVQAKGLKAAGVSPQAKLKGGVIVG